MVSKALKVDVITKKWVNRESRKAKIDLWLLLVTNSQEEENSEYDSEINSEIK